VGHRGEVHEIMTCHDPLLWGTGGLYANGMLQPAVVDQGAGVKAGEGGGPALGCGSGVGSMSWEGENHS